MWARRTGKWILLESLNKAVRKLSCDATKNDLNMLECALFINMLECYVIIYDDIQSEVTNLTPPIVTVRSRGREVLRDRQKTEHGKKCG